MKKFKKLLSAVSAAVLCALPMINGVATNAAESINTYKVYFDVPANSGVAAAYYNIVYSKNMSEASFEVGNLGGKINRGVYGQGIDNIYSCNYTASEVLMNPGTLFTMKFYGDMSFEEAVTKENLYAAYPDELEIEPNPIVVDIVLLGDANDDGKIDMSDAVCIKSYIDNPSKYPIDKLRAADVNGDGAITEEDSTMIQKYLLKLINHF